MKNVNRRLALACSLLTVMLTPALASGQISMGPYLQDVQEHGIIVVFEGEGFNAPLVRFGQEALDEYVQACTCAGVHCSCTLSDLAPDTGYVYEVRDNGLSLSATGSFRTAPDWARPFRFVVHGDNRSDHASHSIVMQNLLMEEFEFVMNTGDMVGSGEIESEWSDFFEIEAPIVLHKPLYSAVGNHEEDEGEVPIVERIFHWPYEQSNSTSETYYSFTYSNSHFIVLDNFVKVHPWWECLIMGKLYENCLSAEQETWVKIDLAQAAGDPAIEHIFVFMHEGPYSSKEGRTGSAAIRELLPVFAQSKVKVVFSGHDHYFEHGVSGNGIDYVISGGGGAPLYGLKETFMNQLYPHQVLNNKSAHSYQVVFVEGTYLAVTTYNVDEQIVMDSFEVGEKADCVTPEDCAAQDPGPCEGEWTCATYVCVWECAPPPPCNTPEDCGAPPANACLGEWDCSHSGTCGWICEPDPECAVNEDCAEKAPLNDCADAHWACDDEMCEWVCVPDLECVFAYECVGNTAPNECEGGYFACVSNECDWTCPDLTVLDITETPQEDVVSADVGVEPPQDTVQPDVNLKPDTGTPAVGEPPKKDSGCSTGQANPAAAWLLVLLALAVGIVRRSSFACS